MKDLKAKKKKNKIIENTPLKKLELERFSVFAVIKKDIMILSVLKKEICF